MKTVEAWGDTDYAHSTDAAWTDIDFSTLFGSDAGSVAGLVGIAYNPSAGILDFGCRKNGSSDTALFGEMPAGAGIFFGIGVDGNDIAEFYLQDASEMRVYVLGWLLNSEAEFLDSAQSLTISASSTWETFDVASYFTGTALVGLMAATATTFAHWGIQDVGGPDRYGLNLNEIAFGATPLTSEQGEHYTSHTTRLTSYVIGAVTGNVTILGTEDEYDLTAANAYEENDLSGVIGAGSVGIICQSHDGVDGDAVGAQAFRPDGETFDIYPSPMQSMIPIIMPVAESNRIIEYKADSTVSDLYTLAYFTEPAAPTGGAELLSLQHQPPAGMNALNGGMQ